MVSIWTVDGGGREESYTKVLDEDFLSRHDFLVLADERFPVLQDLLFLSVEDSQAIGIFAASLLGQYLLDILYGGLVCDFDARGEFLDRTLRSCCAYVSREVGMRTVALTAIRDFQRCGSHLRFRSVAGIDGLLCSTIEVEKRYVGLRVLYCSFF